MESNEQKPETRPRWKWRARLTAWLQDRALFPHQHDTTPTDHRGARW